MPDQFDGWDDGKLTKYFVVFVVWSDEKRLCIYYYRDSVLCKYTLQNRMYLLRLCPLVKYENYGADSHVESIEKFLGGIGKTMANISVMMGDNCTTNISLANKAHKPFIGCYSHRLNLAVKFCVRPQQPLLAKINSLMILLSSKKYCGRLREGGCK